VKILILKPSSLGDVVQALPVLRLLKQHRPTSEIYWWIGTDLHSLLENDPDLAGLFPFRRHLWNSPLQWPNALSSIRAMRAKRFDWVIDLQGLARSGLFAWLAAGELTIGVDDPREAARGFYDIAVRRPSPQTHAVDWYLQVLRVLQVPVHWQFTWLPGRAQALASIRRQWQPDSTQWIIINPGARWLNKRWPVEYFCQVVSRLAKALPAVRFAILGGNADVASAAAIAAAAPDRCLDLTGKTSLPEMVEWIRLATLMITNDTGPMHVAAALGKKVVAVFGPTDPRRTGPYGQIEHAVRIRLPCSPCLKPDCSYVKPIECLRAIRPDEIVQATLDRVKPAGPAETGLLAV
jgi:lipopolysaccharide heptosyltransferase II